jgi:WD40 repeat protein
VAPDGTATIISEKDGTLTAWKVVKKSGRCEGESVGRFAEGIRHLTVSADGKFVGVASDTAVSVWDVSATPRQLATVEIASEINMMNFSPDGTRLIYMDQWGDLKSLRGK